MVMETDLCSDQLMAPLLCHSEGAPHSMHVRCRSPVFTHQT